jgi:hypothetical protein
VCPAASEGGQAHVPCRVKVGNSPHTRLLTQKVRTTGRACCRACVCVAGVRVRVRVRMKVHGLHVCFLHGGGQRSQDTGTQLPIAGNSPQTCLFTQQVRTTGRAYCRACVCVGDRRAGRGRLRKRPVYRSPVYLACLCERIVGGRRRHTHPIMV